MLPAAKVTREIADAREVPVGVTVHSPSTHKEFSDVAGLVDFVERIAEATGVPVGIKSAVGETGFWRELAHQMTATERGVDFITIDGGEGGSGAAPQSLMDHVSLSIAEALPLVAGAVGPFGLQAAIAAEHARAEKAGDTNWPAIVALYDRLRQVAPSPVVELNRAVAVAMVEGPGAGLEIIETLEELEGYHLLHSARAELLRRLGDSAGAKRSYARALELVGNDSERRFLERRLAELS